MDPLNVNPADPVAGFSAVARNFTGLGAVMKKGGYKTHFAGKWDCGMATPDHTPMGRGYDESLIYFHHMCVPDRPASV
jgi:arylsulfatase I/J